MKFYWLQPAFFMCLGFFFLAFSNDVVFAGCAWEFGMDAGAPACYPNYRSGCERAGGCTVDGGYGEFWYKYTGWVQNMNYPNWCIEESPYAHTVEGWCCTPGSAGDIGCGGGGGACFLPGTQVSTPQGEKSIETLKPGDKVFSFDELTGKKLLNVVQNSPVRTVPQYYIIKTESGREVKVTAEHPFLTKSKEDQRRPKWEWGVRRVGRLGELVRFIKSKISGVVRASDWL